MDELKLELSYRLQQAGCLFGISYAWFLHTVSPLDHGRIPRQNSVAVFCVNAGRSGSGFLASLLGETFPNTHHEPRPDLFNFLGKDGENSFIREKFFNLLKFPKLKGSDEELYIETSHAISKGYVSIVLKSCDNVRFIVLNRDLESIAHSLYALNTVPVRTAKGRRFLWRSTRQAISSVSYDPDLCDLGMCYWYVADHCVYTETYKYLFRQLGIEYIEVNFDELASWDRYLDLVDFIDPSSKALSESDHSAYFIVRRNRKLEKKRRLLPANYKNVLSRFRNQFEIPTYGILDILVGCGLKKNGKEAFAQDVATIRERSLKKLDETLFRDL